LIILFHVNYSKVLLLAFLPGLAAQFLPPVLTNLGLALLLDGAGGAGGRGLSRGRFLKLLGDYLLCGQTADEQLVVLDLS
jgi:hypothetical protein